MSTLDDELFPNGIPTGDLELARLFELYTIMVQTSESLVARRQSVNTFFLTINGAILTAAGLVISHGESVRLKAGGLVVLTLTGGMLSLAWTSLIRSFGQLNKGKFAVINRIEQLFPAAIFLAEWKALGEGKQPKTYRTFSSREAWTPRAFFCLYLLATIAALIVAMKPSVT